MMKKDVDESMKVLQDIMDFRTNVLQSLARLEKSLSDLLEKEKPRKWWQFWK